MPEIWPSNLFYSSPQDSICILSDRSNGPTISFDSNDLKYPLTLELDSLIRSSDMLNKLDVNLVY